MRLNLEEREALEAQCNERLSSLAQQGVGIGDVATRLIVLMLAELLSVEQEANAKENWLFWLSDLLDTAESAVRQRMLSSGIIAATNGK